MHIYFCGAIMGGRENRAAYERIVAHLAAEGHVVFTHHVASPDVLEQERELSARAVFERDAAWLNQAEIVIAEVSTPSLGVGYEIARGVERGIPMLCLYRDGLQISKMITGNTAPNLQVQTYRDDDEMKRRLTDFLAGRQPVQGLAQKQGSSDKAMI